MCVGIRQAKIVTLTLAVMDGFCLERKRRKGRRGEERRALLLHSTVFFLYLLATLISLVTTGQWWEIELEIVGNRRSIISSSGGIYFFPLAAFQQTAEKLMGIAVTVRTHLNDCSDFGFSNNIVLQCERLRSPLWF